MTRKSHEERGSSTFDYVIIGAGTAGLACASMLSTDPAIRVCVLEAGHRHSHEDPKIAIPGMMGQTLMDPEYDWCLSTVPQPHANDRTFAMPRGKLVGGSSAINFMCWQRGFKRDFDDIAALGNPGWAWDDLSETYNELTNVVQASTLSDEQRRNGAAVGESFHGDQGPIHLSHAVWYCEVQALWRRMMEDHVGKASDQDGSGSGAPNGTWNSLVTVHPTTLRRVHAGTAFHEPIRDRRANLSLVCDAHVERLELCDDALRRRVTGVRVVQQGKARLVKARREVIVCAGSLLSPKLLELSGIGNPTLLRSHDIDVKVSNENVGEHLQEHLYVSSTFEVDERITTFDSLKDGRLAARATDATEGIMVSPMATAFAFTSLDAVMSPKEIDEMKQAANVREGETLSVRTQREKLFSSRSPALEFSLLPTFFSSEGQAREGKSYISPLAYLQYPLSMGSVHITSADPVAEPRIDPCFFSNEADLLSMAHALKSAVQWVESDPALAEKIVKRCAPAQHLTTIEQWQEYVRQHAGATYHPVGTCSMMPRQSGGVVDAHLRVYGVENLPVADASVIPLMPSGHIQAACYVIGCKAAKMIVQREELARAGD